MAGRNPESLVEFAWRLVCCQTLCLGGEAKPCKDRDNRDRIRSRIARFASFTVLLLCVVRSASGQFPKCDAFDPTAVGTVYTLGLQPDGKILIGGVIGGLFGQSCSNLGRIYPTGMLDTGFRPTISGPVRSTALQTDGSILVGGNFTNIDGQARANLGRLYDDGTLDMTFNPAVNGPVYSMSVQPDAMILIGGQFTMVSGMARGSVARLSAEGILDPTFDGGSDGTIYSIAVQTNGDVIVGGEFSMLGGAGRKNIGRIFSNGVLDTNFNPEVEGIVYSLALQPGGRILVGGQFNMLGGLSRTNFGRLNADGTSDSSFMAQSDGKVSSIVMQADGKILVGNAVRAVSSLAPYQIARFDKDGIRDASYNPSGGTNVNAMVMQSDGKLIVGGQYFFFGGQLHWNVCRLNGIDPASSVLSSEDNNVHWVRAGAVADFSRTTFEVSSDGAIWNLLGGGARVADGWQLSDIALPTNYIVRARGFVSGSPSGSGWYEEATTASAPLITKQSVRQIALYEGAPFSLAIEAVGDAPIHYHWYRNGFAVMDATNSELSIGSIHASDAGDYNCIVSNVHGVASSGSNTLTVLPLPTNMFPIAVLADHPIAYWRLNEGNGKPASRATNGLLALDHAGGHDGVYNTNVQIGAAGYSSKDTDTAADFSKYAKSYVGSIRDIDFSQQGSNAEFSVEAWVSGGGSLDSGIAAVGYGAEGEQFDLDNYGGSWRFFVRAPNVAISMTYGLPAASGSGFIHLVGVCDQSNGVIRLYINGILRSSNYMTPGSGIRTANTFMTIGARNMFYTSTSPDLQFRGVVDDLALYDYPLSAAQVQQHYAAAKAVSSTPPTIDSQPRSQSQAPGMDVTLTASGSGSGYQWKFQGANIPGATGNEYTITNFSSSNAGIYSLSLSNSAGSKDSSNANITLGPVGAWGNNLAAQTDTPSSTSNAVAIAAGMNHSLALKANGTVIAWGDNSYSQTTIPSGLNGNVTAIAAGDYHSVALLSNGTVRVWGQNSSGQANVPSGLAGVKAIAAGSSHNLALKQDGTVVAWGSNGSSVTNVPTSATNVIAIACGGYHSLALRADGTIIAWGNNSARQLAVPPGLDNVVALSGGLYHSLALRADGSVVAWGDNAFGQTNLPVGLRDVVAISSKYFHNLFLRRNGTVVASGYNSFGQAIVPAGLANISAISAGGYHSMVLYAGHPILVITGTHANSVGQFGFNAGGAPSQVIVVERSTDLVDWIPLQTNILGSAPFPFLDNTPVAGTQSFYRLRAAP